MLRLQGPARTVVVLQDFDWTVAYASLHWGLVQPGTEELGPAPQASPRFKWIGVRTSELQRPGQTGDRHVAAVRDQIDRALGLGYQVLIGRIWDMTPAELQLTGGTITDSAKVALLHAMLHRDYSATLAFDDPLAGRFYRLQRAR